MGPVQVGRIEADSADRERAGALQAQMERVLGRREAQESGKRRKGADSLAGADAGAASGHGPGGRGGPPPGGSGPGGPPPGGGEGFDRHGEAGRNHRLEQGAVAPQARATSRILVGRILRWEEITDSVDTGRASLQMRMVNGATGRAEWTDTVSIALPQAAAGGSGTMDRQLAEAAIETMRRHYAP